MSDDILQGAGKEPLTASGDLQTLGSSTLCRLIEEMIRMRGRNEAQHKLFESTLTKVRDEMKSSFNSFAADTQRAYQQLRQDVQGEKKHNLTLLMTLLELSVELEHLTNVRPDLDDRDAVGRWAEAVGVQSRKIKAALKQHGVVEYNAQVGSPYNPALHERVGSARFEGLGPLLVGEQKEPGYASSMSDFKLVRAKVIVSE